MGIAFFIVLTIAAFGYAGKNFSKLHRNINLGRDEKIEGNTAERWRNVVLVAFGQKKMFKNMTPAILHLFIYVAFLFTQIELIEILIDGGFGLHRFFAPYLGGFYTFLISVIEILSFLAFVATIAFLSRRFILKVARFQKPELKGFPTIDAALILGLEILLVFAIFLMNGSDQALQHILPEKYHHTGTFALSGTLIAPLLEGIDPHILVGMERMGWWLHYFVVLAFLNYLPFSKHLHIIFAFPNTYFSRLNSRGEIQNMPEITTEVRSMLGIPAPEGEEAPPSVSAEITGFGAKDVMDLSWKNLLDAYSCTECGRCTAACPANTTGKKLSPRKIMMDVRDRMEDVGKKLDSGHPDWIKAEERKTGAVLTTANFDDGKSLFDLIAPEELHACTTCNACVEACPVMINPLDIIVQMRRYEILTLSQGPSDWVPMFTALENGGSVWQMPVERDAWVNDF